MTKLCPVILFGLIALPAYGQGDGTLFLNGTVRSAVLTTVAFNGDNVRINTFSNSTSKYDIYVISDKYEVGNEINIPNKDFVNISIISK